MGNSVFNNYLNNQDNNFNWDAENYGLNSSVNSGSWMDGTTDVLQNTNSTLSDAGLNDQISETSLLDKLTNLLGGGDSGNSLKTGLNGEDTGSGWMGKFSTGAGALSSLADSFLGYKNYQLSKQSLQDSNDQWLSNYEAQRTTANNEIERKNRNRAASSSSGNYFVADKIAAA